MMSVRALILAAAIGAAAPPGVRTTGQALPRDLNDWTLEYTVSGGLAPRLHAVSLTSRGALDGRDSQLGYHVTARASDAVLAQASAFLKRARQLEPGGAPIPDMPSTDLTVKAGGRTYTIQATPDIQKTLNDAFYAAVTGALGGDWWQSAWKLCKPVAQLGPGDIDPAIETLTFKDDGTFAVTWPGGPRTTGIPHVQVPDYAGRYTVDSSRGAISMRIEGGRFVPKDFSGDGSFGLADGELTIRKAWFGTRQARQKPDICELTFKKK